MDFKLFLFLIDVFEFVTVADGGFHMNNSISRDDTTPIMVVIPGLTSDSQSAVSSVLFFCTDS